jgi:hypothetical protein
MIFKIEIVWVFSLPLITLSHGTDFLLVQIYMDDIIFGGSFHTLMYRFQEMMENEFQIFMMRELTFS